MQILQIYKNKKKARRASDQDKAASCQHVGVVCLAALKNKLFPMDYVPGFFNISFGTLFKIGLPVMNFARQRKIQLYSRSLSSLTFSLLGFPLTS